MKLSLLPLAILAFPTALAGQTDLDGDRTAGCVYCHPLEGREAEIGIHQRSGIDCIACHNGNPKERADPQAAHGPDFLPLRGLAATVESCGGCHADPERMAHFGLKTDQLALYKTSSHGKALFLEGLEDVAGCTTCHGTHRVLPVSDPRSEASKIRLTKSCMECHEDTELMSSHGIDSTPPANYRDSVHGKELLQAGNLASPGCLDCHGSHGAAPPRVGEIEMVCGHCHTPEREQFRKSPHYLASLRGEMDECTSCHDNHAVEHLDSDELVDENGLCATCHSDPGEEARQVARRIHEDLWRLEDDIARVEREVANAALRGLFLRDHDGFVVELRSLRRSSAPVTHASSVEVLDEVVQRGNGMVHKTGKSLGELEKRFRDLKLFASLFLFVSILLAGLILAFRREL